MKNIFTFLLLVFIGGQFLWGQPANLVWNTQSRNASESMPCGGGDIGMNVWVENDDVLFYLSRSGSFDENNCLLKQGRFRVRLTRTLLPERLLFSRLCILMMVMSA